MSPVRTHQCQPNGGIILRVRTMQRLIHLPPFFPHRSDRRQNSQTPRPHACTIAALVFLICKWTRSAAVVAVAGAVHMHWVIKSRHRQNFAHRTPPARFGGSPYHSVHVQQWQEFSFHAWKGNIQNIPKVSRMSLEKL